MKTALLAALVTATALVAPAVQAEQSRKADSSEQTSRQLATDPGARTRAGLPSGQDHSGRANRRENNPASVGRRVTPELADWLERTHSRPAGR